MNEVEGHKVPEGVDSWVWEEILKPPSKKEQRGAVCSLCKQCAFTALIRAIRGLPLQEHAGNSKINTEGSAGVKGGLQHKAYFLASLLAKGDAGLSLNTLKQHEVSISRWMRAGPENGCEQDMSSKWM
eukprot:1156859-Pelagomonas_calceolata.AAC.2